MPDESPMRARNQDATPTVRELAIVLFRRRRVFVRVALAVLAGAMLWAAFGTRYQAHMKIMVRSGRADAPVSAGQNAPLDLTRMAVSEEELNSEVELLRDDEVLRRVVQEKGIGGRDWFHFIRLGEGPAARLERPARGIARKLRVEPIKKTNLIAVSYVSGDPQVAQTVLQGVADAYLQKHVSVHRPNGEVNFFQQQVDESRRHLEDSKERLLRFSALHGSVSAGLQRDLALQKLSDVDASQRQTGIELAETGKRISALRDLLSNLPERSTTQVRTADNPELLKALKSSLLELELKRTQLLTKFEPSHRLVQEVEQQIAQAQDAIARETMNPVRDETSDKNTHFEWASSELEKAQVQSTALQGRQSATGAQAAAYRGIAAKFGEDAITQEDLLSSEKAALEKYLLYVKKQEEARLDDALDARGIVNVAIAEAPTAPALPVWPASMILAAGFISAGVAGTAGAFLADYLDPAVRDANDVKTYLNAPLLASLPSLAPGRLRA